MSLEGEREAHPQLGDRPGPDEVGYIRCEHGHIPIGPSSSFTIDEAVDVDLPKGEFNPYCVSCIMLWAIKKARLKPMRFYIAKKPAGVSQQPQIVVPESGLFVPKDATEGRQPHGRQRR